jgi:hypothetical protein
MAGTIETARAIISGPTSRTVSLTVTPDSITGNITGLAPGTYTVIVEGMIGGDVERFGQANSVNVTAGATATASMVFGSFRPDLSGFGLTSTTAFSFDVTFPAVSGATDYDIEWDTDSGFGNPSSATATSPSLTVTVSQATTYSVRVRSRNSGSTAVGRWSDPKTVDVLAAPSGSPGAPTPTLGDTLVPPATDSIQIVDVNVPTAGVEDWFSVQVCMGDTLTIGAIAANLAPPSPLNTHLLVIDGAPGTDTLAQNSDSIGTDAVVRFVVPNTDTVRVRVTGENNTVGHFEVRLARSAGLGRSPIGSCLGIEPDRLGIRTIGGGTAGSPFTVEVEIQDQWGALVEAAAHAVTLTLGANPGSMVLHLSGHDNYYRYVDYTTPTLLPHFVSGVPIGEMYAVTYDSINSRFLSVDYRQHFYQIDPLTGQTDTIALNLTTRLRGLAFVDNGTRLLGAARDTNLI